jgi:hypothetical protein
MPAWAEMTELHPEGLFQRSHKKTDRRSVFKFQLNSGGRERGSLPPACFLLARNIKTVRRSNKKLTVNQFFGK